MHQVFQTSGSTGRPARIVHSDEGLRVSAEAVNTHLGVDRHSCWGLVLPRRHVGGYGVVLRAEVAGCRMAEWPRPWDAEGFAGWLAGERVTHTSLVPTQVHDLVRAELRPPSGLSAIVVGGGSLDEATGLAARDLGWPVLPSYGLTEAGSQVATASLESLGQSYQPQPLPLLPIWEVRCGSDRRIRLRGPALFVGRIEGGDDDPEFIEREGDWFETNDLGELDARGWLGVTGRADSLVKVLGELVDPLVIERALVGHAPVGLDDRVAVVAVPDQRAGRRLVPVREAGVDEAAAEAARDAWQRTCPGYARLADWVVIERFPRSPLGKLQRAQLTAKVERIVQI